MRRTRSCSHLSRGAAGCREYWSTARNGCYSWARGTEGGGHGGFDVEHRGSRHRGEKVARAITAHVQKEDRDAVRVLFSQGNKNGGSLIGDRVVNVLHGRAGFARRIPIATAVLTVLAVWGH